MKGPEGVGSYLTISCLLLLASCLGVRSNAQEPALLPPSQSVAPAIVTADSGVKPSGTGNNWSKWYCLGVGKAPEGYTVQRAEFWLSGDRTCGVSAECREISRNDHKVEWEFRLKGNVEHGVPEVVLSEGHIRVFYRLR
jgi:hypothetical protein